MHSHSQWAAADEHYAAGRYDSALQALMLLGGSVPYGFASFALAIRLAMCLHSLRRVDEAEPWFQKALSFGPANSGVRWEYAMQCLLLGRFDPGWRHYEQRLPLHGKRALHIYPFEMPAWQGESLRGRTILIHGEQGFGDEIMFASVINDVIALAGRCVIACSPQLHSLFARSFGNATVVPLARGNPVAWASEDAPAWLRQVGPIDFQIPCGSLPHVLRKELAEFPRSTYLHADKARVDEWRHRIEAQRHPGDRWRVGVAWAGNRATGSMGERKSVSLEALRPLADIPGVRLVSLHTPDHAGEASTVPDMRVLDCSGHLRDFDDTAALMSACDLVVSVDTSIVHLAGSLGLRTLLPLWHGSDWRWGRDDRDLWWYPQVHMFRQHTPGDWRPVIEKLATQARNQLISGANPVSAVNRLVL